MMTNIEKQIVTSIYRHFLESELEGWTEIDDMLELMEMLNDQEVVDESVINNNHFMQHGVQCGEGHNSPDECFAGVILEAVNAILRVYLETRVLHEKNRYILLYFLTLSEMKLIF